MKNNKRNLVPAMLLFCLMEFSGVVYSAGTTGADFLNIGVGARPIAMGGAYAGLSDDINAMYWNPAGLNNVSGREISGSYIMWLEGISSGQLAFAQKQSNGNVIGIGVDYLTSGTIEQTEIDTNSSYVATGKTFSSNDMMANVSLARSIGSDTVGGVSLKLIQCKIENESASSYAGDVGILTDLINYDLPLMLGISVQNLGSGIKYTQDTETLPMTYRVGLSYIYMVAKSEDKINLAFDVSKAGSNDMDLHLGAEYMMGKSIALRAGYKKSGGSESLTSLSGGFGYIDKSGIGLDYAWVPYGDLGVAHRISITNRF
ncbi:MAG: hypothetical protein A2252_06780 [Elusimicrobia bacterium RIFOXYA2_FULL_39_19]|nr:MAG: hypothetical protein A2252_06780 [Elusimicrobia bacterium RIFOXYA2_FULL_39_19]